MSYTPPTFKSSLSGGFTPYTGAPASSTGLTPLQRLEMQYLLSQQHPHHSILGKVFHGAEHGIQSALQFIARPAAAVATGTDVAVKGGGPEAIAKGAGLGLQGKSHVGFGQVLEDAGMLKGHRTLRGLAGFGLDVATDPILLASVAAAPITGGASLSLIAEREAAMGLERGTLSEAATRVLRGVGEHPTAVDYAQLHKARDVLRAAGEGFDIQKGLGELQLNKIAKGLAPTKDLAHQEAVLTEGATAEYKKALGDRYLNLRLRVPFTRQILNAGTEHPGALSTRIPHFLPGREGIKAPSLSRVAENEFMKRVPGLNVIPGLAERAGQAFKPGWNNETFHAMKMVGVRILEHLYDNNISAMGHHLGEFFNPKTGLKKADQFHALSWGEEHPGIVKGPQRKLNITMLQKAIIDKELTPKQARFIAAWHGVTEHMRLQDEAYGLKYDKPLKDVLYVPHLYTKTGNSISSVASMLTKPGFEYRRLSNKASSIKTIHELFDSGHYRKEIETDPQKLLAIRIRRGARAASENKVKEVIAAHTGVPARIINQSKKAARQASIAKRQNSVMKLGTLSDYNNVRRKAVYAAIQKGVPRFHARVIQRRERLSIARSSIKHYQKEVDAFYKRIHGTKFYPEGGKPKIRPVEAERKLRGAQSRFDTELKNWSTWHSNYLKKRNVAIHSAMNKVDDKAIKEANRYDLEMKKIRETERLLEENYAKNPSLYTRNPEAFKPGMVIEPKLRHENGGEISIPEGMSQALNRTVGSTTNDAFMNEFRSVWQRLIGKWKVGVTVVNPGYRVRNTMSDLWNMYAKPERHVPIWAIGKYGDMSAKMIYRDLKHPGTAEGIAAGKMLDEAFSHGIFAGLFQGDVEKVMKFTSQRGSSKELIKTGHPLAGAAKFATTFNAHAENWGRLTHYLYLRKYLHMDPAAAAADVRATHFDYEDLTNTERWIKSNLIPFYTWTRKNIPFQISSLLQSPGKYSTLPLFMRESEYASGDTSNQIVPDWMKQNLGFHIPLGPKGTMYVPQFGPTDIAKAQHPSNLLSLLTPPIKVPLELLMNKSTLSGAPLYGSQLAHPRAPVSDIAAKLFKYFPGANVGQTERVVGGKPTAGPGMNPVYSYLASQTPWTNFLFNQGSNIRKGQRGQNTALLSQLLGQSAYSLDQGQQQTILQQQEAQAFKQFLRGLRDEGKIKNPKQHKLSSFQKQQIGLLRLVNK